MRFPVSITYSDTNETLQILDHRMVFQLADVLNRQNKNASEYRIDFVEWIQSAANDPANTSKRRPDGTIPGSAEAASDPAYFNTANLTYSNATAVYEAEGAFEEWARLDREHIRDIARNIFKSHKLAIENGLFDWSEAQYINHVLGYSKNITDQVVSFADVYPTWLYEDVYFAATEWRTIDKGLSRLPAAFGPAVLNRTIFGTAVQGMEWNSAKQKMTIKYRNQGNLLDISPSAMEFDYVVVAVPFSRVRLWRLPDYSSLLSRAINTLNYGGTCKVALHYKTRFWEHLERPIIGGCGSVDIPGIGSICYPSYQINSTGPGVILASYVSRTFARSVTALTEEEHIALVQRAMIETHGVVAQEQWTGNYDRICWEVDRYQAGAWADPLVGQQDLYLPAYFHTEKHTVFVGEHTSYTSSWIWSALESAVRGTTQLLLDMGLVDEAKEITEFWMARWISV
nr:l-amino-acid oxidase [Quercus suber]